MYVSLSKHTSSPLKESSTHILAYRTIISSMIEFEIKLLGVFGFVYSTLLNLLMLANVKENKKINDDLT